jgi:transcriptional regulator with XRE-family HTH domain
MSFAAGLRALLAERRITEKELAAALGIRAETVSRWYTGASAGPSIALAARTADALGVFLGRYVSLDELCERAPAGPLEQVARDFRRSRPGTDPPPYAGPERRDQPQGRRVDDQSPQQRL